MRSPFKKYLSAVLPAILLAACSGPEGRNREAAPARVQVEGLVTHPLQLGPGPPEGFAVDTLRGLEIFSAGGRLKKRFDAGGILLRTLLDSAGIRAPDRKRMRGYHVLLRAADGYRVAFSWEELYGTAVGDSVFLLFGADSGVSERDGPWMSISLLDRVRGPRYVKWLKSIEVKSD